MNAIIEAGKVVCGFELHASLRPLIWHLLFGRSCEKRPLFGEVFSMG